MKTEVSVKKQRKIFKFPLVAVAKDYKYTVLFTSRYEGTLIACDDAISEYKIGYTSKDCVFCLDEDFWDIPEEVNITLKNE